MDETNTSGADQIDAEMGELLGETPTPSGSESTSQKPQTSTPQSWKAGGREFKTPDEIAKAYDNVWRMHSKLQNEAKPFFQFRDYLSKDPGARQAVAEALAKYQEGREAGLTKKQAEQASGIPAAMAEKIERFDAALEDMKVEKEINALRSKYQLDNNAIREVLNLAAANNGIPLELAYKAYAHDTGYKAAAQKGKEQAVQEADASKLGATSKAPVVNAAPKGFNLSSDKGWRNAASEGLKKFGITD